MNKFYKFLFIFASAIVALACSHSTKPTGKAILTGKFSGAFPVGKIITINLAVPNLVLGELKQYDEYEIPLEPDGSFSLSVPLFIPVYAMLSADEEEYSAFFLSPDKETKVELSLDESDKLQIKLIEGKEFTMEDDGKINESYFEAIVISRIEMAYFFRLSLCL